MKVFFPPLESKIPYVMFDIVYCLLMPVWLCVRAGLQRKHAAHGDRVFQNSWRDGDSSSASSEEHPSVPLRRDPRTLQPTNHSLTASYSWSFEI